MATADDSPSRNAATRSIHCNFTCHGDSARGHDTVRSVTLFFEDSDDDPDWSVLHGESHKRLAPPRNTIYNTYNQHVYKRPPIGTTHRPSTRYHRKGSPRIKSHNTNQHSSRARHQQHSNLPPSFTHTQQGHREILSANAVQCEAQAA